MVGAPLTGVLLMHLWAPGSIPVPVSQSCGQRTGYWLSPCGVSPPIGRNRRQEDDPPYRGLIPQLRPPRRKRRNWEHSCSSPGYAPQNPKPVSRSRRNGTGEAVGAKVLPTGLWLLPWPWRSEEERRRLGQSLEPDSLTP